MWGANVFPHLFDRNVKSFILHHVNTNLQLMQLLMMCQPPPPPPPYRADLLWESWIHIFLQSRWCLEPLILLRAPHPLHVFCFFFRPSSAFAIEISPARRWQISFPCQAAKLKGLNLSLCLCVWILSKSSDVFSFQRILPCHCLKLRARRLFLADTQTRTHASLLLTINHPLTHSF